MAALAPDVTPFILRVTLFGLAAQLSRRPPSSPQKFSTKGKRFNHHADWKAFPFRLERGFDKII